MSAKDVLVWLFARKTKAGSRYLYGDPEAARRLRMQEAEQLRDRLDAIQAKLDERNAEVRASGHRHVYEPYATDGMLGDVHVIIKFHESNDPTKVDVFYGGERVPDGQGHGHITMRRGVIDTWFLPADANGNRERIV